MHGDRSDAPSVWIISQLHYIATDTCSPVSHGVSMAAYIINYAQNKPLRRLDMRKRNFVVRPCCPRASKDLPKEQMTPRVQELEVGSVSHSSRQRTYNPGPGYQTKQYEESQVTVIQYTADCARLCIKVVLPLFSTRSRRSKSPRHVSRLRHHSSVFLESITATVNSPTVGTSTCIAQRKWSL